jgi:DNA-binding NtrC family response regulator
MDLTIPGGMGGQEAVRRILEIDPDAGVIVSSGYSNDPVMANFSDYGFIASIAKPFDMQDLCNLITEALGK